MVITLVFEGIVRKVIPSLGAPIFFLKDILCVAGLFLVYSIKLPDIIEKLSTIWVRLFFLFLPLLLFTASKDLILGVFAAKQYLLYIVIGMMVAVSFPAYKEERFRRFIFTTTLLLIPTTLIAILQNSLPATHWLNVSVGGDSLEAFAAAGYLRVGSTFSFTGQYSWFLNAESFFLLTSFFMPPDFKNKSYTNLKGIIYPVLALMLIVGVFITGGRTAVLGCGGTLALGFALIGSKTPGIFLTKALPIIAICVVGLIVLRAVRPQFFSAYDERSAGNSSESHSEEITNRVLSGFTDWTDWVFEQDTQALLVGNGLGIMSNGVGQVSSYASKVRANGFWTEADVPTTFWEGGIYLGIVWYGFRLIIIGLCYRLWSSLQNKILVSAAAVPFAYVVIHGLIAQFGIQPPLSIWWWLAIGIIMFIYRLEKFPAPVMFTVPGPYQDEEKSDIH